MANKKTAAAPAAAAPAFALEPGLPWIPLSVSMGSEQDYTAFLADKLRLGFRTDSMAPNFPAGCYVLAERVATAAELRPGVYVVVHSGQLYCVGRLSAGGITAPPLALRLSLDNGPTPAPVVLDFADAALQVWRVAYYASYPAE